MPFRPGHFFAGLVPVLMLALVPLTSAQDMELPKPTKEHEMLKKDVGTWDATVKMWMGPGDPVESKAVETSRMIGDIWVITDFDGEMAGMTFKGHGSTGYDPLKKKFVGTWVDTFSTSPMLMEGTYDEKTGETTMIGESVDATGSKAQMKNISKHHADGTRSFTMFMKGDMTGGEWVKSMEVTYTPRKPAAR